MKKVAGKLNNSTYEPFLKRNMIYIVVLFITEIRLIWNYLFGFRWPSSYVLSCNVFTYDFGFMPRAFIASAVKLVFGNHIYSLKFLYILIIGSSLLILFFFMYMSYYFNIRTRNIVGGVLILWYSLSIYSAYISYEMGYFEQYAYALLCIFILLAKKIKSPDYFTFLCSALSLVILLISETNAFFICPILFFMNLKKLIKKPYKKSRFESWLIFLFGYLFSIIYCIAIGMTSVPKAQIEKLLTLIKNHASYFENLDEIGEYFYNGRIYESYSNKIEFKVWEWQLKFYMFLILLTVSIIFMSAKQYQKAIYYIVAVIIMMLCLYSLNFIAWDTDRFKFGAAMAVTFFSIWIISESEIKITAINREMFYILIIGTMGMIMIMDYRLGEPEGVTYNNSLAQFISTLRNTWQINY